MNFSSLNFIFLFLPIFVLIHSLLRGKARNAVLFFGSFVFYSFAVGHQIEWLILLLLSALVTFVLGLIIADTQKSHRRAIFVLGLIYQIAILCLFKYAQELLPHVMPSLSSLFNIRFDASSILQPLGISFYTFKNISYLHEVYSEKVKAEESFLNYGAYLVMFPQISMGPIQTYESFQPALIHRDVTLAGISSGTMTFIAGFGLKTIFANRLGGVWNGIETIGYDAISTPLAWLGILAYALQLYFDFYGYSLMASGIGEMLGYQTPQNFRDPYMATSMSDFWRRWHMTLGSWFKENVYFPLGGNRCSKWKQIRNLFLVWLLTGVWHGSTVTFVLWGCFLFIVIAIEKSGALDKVIRHKVFSHVYMIPLILLSWTIFKLPTIRDLGIYLSRMFPFFAEVPEFMYANDWVKYATNVGWLMGIGILFCTPLPRQLYEKIKDKSYIVIPLLLGIFWYSVYLSACGANDPFLYFQF